MDTVSAYELEDFGAEEKGDVITGLGAADMKGASAAMIEAFTCLLEQGITQVLLAFTSHSDANQLWTAGVKPVILGCGRLEKAHSPDEDVSFEQVLGAAEIYFQTAARMAAQRRDV